MTRCIKCKANITNLSLIPIINEYVKGNFDMSVYELSSYGSTLDYMKNKFNDVTISEYFPKIKLGEIHNGVLNQDVQQLTFSDKSFDIVTSNQVFEHVENDIKGFSEVCRVLKQGGAFIFGVPLYETETTIVKATVINGNLIFNGEPEFHDSRLDGANSAPVFYRHSFNDICERVKSVGFSKAELKEVTISKNQGEPQLVILAIK
jgi:ubiquinone/menaquinone biosynthesis C-methylase UbiE